jgi:flagellar L-ring protein precursor FlgH
MSRQLWWCSKAAPAAVLLAFSLCSATSSAQSLWKDGSSKSMVSDKRATHVGDILTIIVQENNTASKDQNTRTSKETGLNAQVESFFYSPDASKLLTHNGKMPAIKMNSAQNFEGGGRISNAEKVTARIAVRVIDVLPNENLVIEGTRQIAFSGETQDAVLRGVVRKEDIAANNTIFSYHIADATIRYISKGTVSDNQRKGWFTKVWEKVTPF